MAARRSYAAVFSFRNTVEGAGFLARVTACGRALMVHEEDDSWWLYGVEPGAIAESGASGPEAYAAFRRAFTKVLFDFVAGAENFVAFRAQVQDFFVAADEAEEAEWRASVEALRSGELELEKPLDELPRWDADGACDAVVERLDVLHRRFRSDENVLDELALSDCA